MRTLVDIPEQIIDELRSLCQDKGLSRAEIIRRAINSYIQQQKPKKVNTFGLWKKEHTSTEDGLAYQNKLRNEW